MDSVSKYNFYSNWKEVTENYCDIWQYYEVYKSIDFRQMALISIYLQRVVMCDELVEEAVDSEITEIKWKRKRKGKKEIEVLKLSLFSRRLWKVTFAGLNRGTWKDVCHVPCFDSLCNFIMMILVRFSIVASTTCSNNYLSASYIQVYCTFLPRLILWTAKVLRKLFTASIILHQYVCMLLPWALEV